MRRFLAVLLVLSLVLGLASTSFADAKTSKEMYIKQAENALLEVQSKEVKNKENTIGLTKSPIVKRQTKILYDFRKDPKFDYNVDKPVLILSTETIEEGLPAAISTTEISRLSQAGVTASASISSSPSSRTASNTYYYNGVAVTVTGYMSGSVISDGGKNYFKLDYMENKWATNDPVGGAKGGGVDRIDWTHICSGVDYTTQKYSTQSMRKTGTTTWSSGLNGASEKKYYSLTSYIWPTGSGYDAIRHIFNDIQITWTKQYSSPYVAHFTFGYDY